MSRPKACRLTDAALLCSGRCPRVVLGWAPFVHPEETNVRVCNTPGCGTLVEAGACSTHAKAADKSRGTRQERGYGRDHERLRAQLLPQAYGQPCTHCQARMWPHEALALDHTEDRQGYRGIVHASCNASEGASRGNRARTPGG